jgi:hypothetical protein
LTEDADAKARLVHEAQAASALDHPNICSIYEIDETPDKRMFLAMAYYEGETLKQRIARAAVGVDEAITLIAHLARGAAAAHEAGIVHRDIKPANIMLTRRSEVKLFDFGLARVTGQTVLTRTGSTVGTVAYMAPEQIAGQAADERSDVWALGVVLYEMLAGRLPFTGEHDVAVLRAIADGRPQPLRNIRPDTPTAVEAIVARALRKDAKARYASAGDFLKDVEALRAPSVTVTSPQAVIGSRSRTSARHLQLGAAIVLLVVLATGGWYGSRETRARSAKRTLQRVSELVQKEQFTDAYMLLREVQPHLSGDPEFAKIRDSFLWPTGQIQTAPPGADVYVKPYADVSGPWQYLGRSPFEMSGCFCYLRWRVTKAGFSSLEAAAGAEPAPTFTLTPEGTVPDDMVRVPGGTVTMATGGGVRLADYFHRSVRSDEPRVQEVCRRGRVPQSRVLATAVRQRGSLGVVGRSDGRIPRRHRPAGAVDVGARRLRGWAGRLSGARV